jgi:hypothetical protein
VTWLPPLVSAERLPRRLRNFKPTFFYFRLVVNPMGAYDPALAARPDMLDVVAPIRCLTLDPGGPVAEGRAALEIQQLRHLLAAVKYGSFVKAADACHISQSGISRSIRTSSNGLACRCWSGAGPG